MSDVFIYDDCTLEVLISSNWYPILCQVESSFDLEQEIILKTGPNSGLAREKTTRLTETFCSVRGLTPINNGDVISIFYIMQESIRTQPQTIRFRYVDQSGAVSKQISGTALIKKCSLQNTVSDFANASIDFEFSGVPVIEDVTDPPEGTILTYADTWNVTAGQNYLDGTQTSNLYGYTLTGKTILVVWRSGVQYDFIGYSGTPGNRQCMYNQTTNRLIFADNFNDGETVFVEFEF